MIIHFDLQRKVELAGDKGEGLVPFWVQVPVHNSGTVLELTVLELNIRITGAWSGRMLAETSFCVDSVSSTGEYRWFDHRANTCSVPDS